MKFYEKDWFIWLSLVLLAPLGIFLLWKYKKNFKKNTKIIITVLASLFFIFSLGSSQTDYSDTKEANSKIRKVIVEVVDLKSMTTAEMETWCRDNKIDCTTGKEYSDSIEKGAIISQSVEAGRKIYQGENLELIYSLGVKPSAEYLNALAKAENYSEIMHMSKAGIYDQLISPYGEKFPADAAQYAIDNMIADWNANALAKAKSYQDMMNMSKASIYDQLISPYGEKFTKEQAQYAIDNL